jgi:hypothetical protein
LLVSALHCCYEPLESVRLGPADSALGHVRLVARSAALARSAVERSNFSVSIAFASPGGIASTLFPAFSELSSAAFEMPMTT